ncbi:hypothetical protein HMPREF0983_01711 [Erysipelotrichaceae bacterium 3_1_53]|nr:hypothetical protein HMPREF0983_01711 [Erysipelotrichaceae bacterium 3_1_53]
MIYRTPCYTHEDYRSAGVAHIKKGVQACEYYFKGKLISEEEAQKIVTDHLEKKK